MKVETNAKALALSIVEYEDFCQHQHEMNQQQDDDQVGHAPDASMEEPEEGT
jgi:hypothetical protein